MEEQDTLVGLNVVSGLHDTAGDTMCNVSLSLT